MKKSQPTFQLWAILILASALVILFAGFLYPDQVVLGNAIVPNIAAAIAVATILTFLVALVHSFTKQTIFKNAGELQSAAFSAVLNSIGLWILARFALYIGLGISSAVVAVALGIAVTLVQFALTYDWQAKAKKRK